MMSCCHKKREIVVEGKWKRKVLARLQTSAVKEKCVRECCDIIRIYRCKVCGAIRLDSFNDYCYATGKWSLPGAVTQLEKAQKRILKLEAEIDTLLSQMYIP